LRCEVDPSAWRTDDSYAPALYGRCDPAKEEAQVSAARRPRSRRADPEEKDPALEGGAASRREPAAEGMLRLQRSAGNAAVARLLAPSRPVIQRFAELEHKAIGDRAVGDVRYRLSPLVQMTHGDLVAMGDYFSSPDEIASLAATPGKRKGTLGEVYYALFVSVRGQDEKSMMGEWFDESAKAAVNERFYKLAATNVSHFPNPYGGDEELDPRTKAKRHEGPGEPIGQAATYRDGHVRAIRRALELGKAGKPIGGALAIDAFASHFLTDAFSAGHLRTPRVPVQEYWRRKVPDFYQRFQRWLGDTMAEWIDHNGAQWQQAVPMGAKRNAALAAVRDALKSMPPMSFGDVVGLAVHDFDSERGVVVELNGKRMRMVGDGKLLDPEGDDEPGQAKAAHDTMDLAVKAVEASTADVEKAHDLGRGGTDLDVAVARLTSAGKGLFAAERLVPKPVADEKLTVADKSLRWHFDTVEELLQDKRMRRAITIFANNKAQMFDSIMDNPKIDAVAKQGLQVMVQGPMSSSDPNTVIGLFRKILQHAP
jgi:hypothetical protein